MALVPMEKIHPYSGKQALLTSKHRKLELIAPVFQESVGLLITEEALDTDQLGTFSGEIERLLPPLQTAIAKARLGMKEQGVALGIASEGSIGADPLAPFINSDIEHLVLVDDERGIIISEVFRSLEIVAARAEVIPGQNLEGFLRRADFPNHSLIVRPRAERFETVVKGIGSLPELHAAIRLCAEESAGGFVEVESDLRAHHSPSRRRNIERAALLLADRVSHLCPECQSPGWGRVAYEKGLHCGLFNILIPEAIGREVLGCVACDHTAPGKLIAEVADPSICPHCNP